MAKGTNYGCERAIVTDPQSGLRIVRLTHYPTISTNLYFEMESFSEDERHVVFIAQRAASREAPWDLFRVQTDGLELVQMTDRDDLHGIVVSPALGAVLFQSGGQVIRMDLMSLEETPIAAVPGEGCLATPYSLATIDRAGTGYIALAPDPGGGQCIFKVEVATGQVDVLHRGTGLNHLHVDPLGKTLHFNDLDAGHACLIDTDGANYRRSAFREFAHHTWFGTTGKMQGTLLPPGRAVALRGEDDAAFTPLAEGRYYWHSSASRDAQWIVSDTNWPQEGLYLFHVATGRVTYVCDPRASCSHPQWTHPHPALSPSLRYILFNSDFTGVGQVYLAELTDEFIEQARRPR